MKGSLPNKPKIKMKKITLLIAIGLLFVFPALAVDCPPGTQTIEEGGKLKGRKLSCLLFEVHKRTKKVIRVASYVDGRAQGVARGYSPKTGTLLIVRYWRDGKREGEGKIYNEKGQLIEIERWVDGVKLK